MDTETVLAVAGLILATNAPFYILSLQNYRLISWIKQNCPQCIQNFKARGTNGNRPV